MITKTRVAMKHYFETNAKKLYRINKKTGEEPHSYRALPHRNI